MISFLCDSYGRKSKGNVIKFRNELNMLVIKSMYHVFFFNGTCADERLQ